MASTEATPERIATLPQWARDHLAHLEMRVGEAERTLSVVRDGVISDGMREAFSEVWVRGVRNPSDEAHPVLVTRYGSIRHYPVNGDTYVWLDTRVKEEGCLEVMASGPLHIEARSSNVVYLRASR